MKNQLYSKFIIISGIAVLAFAANYSQAQVIAYDAATNSTYSGSFSGLNGGFGFGTWSTSTSGGGSYVGGYNGNTYFGLWNNGYGTGTGSFATRSFGSSLTVGEAFSTSYINYHLNSSLEQEGFSLLDSTGNILFSYWQQGGNNANGDYTDAGVTGGTATGFAYNYNALGGYTFTLTSASTYTFTDLATLASLSGTISGTIDQVQYFRQNLAGDPATGGDGDTDFRFFDMSITTVPEPSSIALAALGGFGLLVAFRRRLS
jgi:hypothetical protein